MGSFGRMFINFCEMLGKAHSIMPVNRPNPLRHIEEVFSFFNIDRDLQLFDLISAY